MLYYYCMAIFSVKLCSTLCSKALKTDEMSIIKWKPLLLIWQFFLFGCGICQQIQNLRYKIIFSFPDFCDFIWFALMVIELSIYGIQMMFEKLFTVLSTDQCKCVCTLSTNVILHLFSWLFWRASPSQFSLDCLVSWSLLYCTSHLSDITFNVLYNSHVLLLLQKFLAKQLTRASDFLL